MDGVGRSAFALRSPVFGMDRIVDIDARLRSEELRKAQIRRIHNVATRLNKVDAVVYDAKGDERIYLIIFHYDLPILYLFIDSCRIAIFASMSSNVGGISSNIMGAIAL